MTATEAGTQILFTIPCVPVAQPRQRHAVRAFGGKAVSVNYTPSKHPVTAFKATARMAAQQAYRGEPLTGPLILEAVFVFPRPGRLVWKKRDMPRLPHESKPDADNLLKSLKDSLSMLCWRDDKQVFKVMAEKWIASGDEQPHVDVTIRTA